MPCYTVCQVLLDENSIESLIVLQTTHPPFVVVLRRIIEETLLLVLD